MSNNCPNCGADLDSNEYIDDDDKCICQSCGFVVAHAGFADPVPQAAPTGGNNVSRHHNGSSKAHYNSDREYQAAGHAMGRKSVITLCGIMSYPSSIVDESLKLFDRVYMHKEFHYRTGKDKHVMAAVCVFITCRKYNWIVTMMSLCQVAGCVPKLFFKWKNSIVKVFDLDVRSVDLLELAKKRCIDVGLDVKTRKKTIQVLELCRGLCISDNRLPEHLVSAASYLAWMSHDPIRRRKVNFKAYCKEHKLSYTRHSSKTVFVISGVMCRLAGELPWVSEEKVCASNVSMHIDDIIKYQTTLMSDSRAKYVALLGPTEGEESSTIDEENDLVESDDESVDISLKTEHSKSVEHNLSRPLSVNIVHDNIDQSRIENDRSNEILDDHSIVKVERLDSQINVAPKSGRHYHLKYLSRADSLLFSVKKEKAETLQPEQSIGTLRHNLDDEELCIEDMPDNEINVYIKSESEVLTELDLEPVS